MKKLIIKKIILIILILLLPLKGLNQSIMLGAHKSRVKIEMSYCENYIQIKNEKNYIEYQNRDTTISFKFYNYMGGWYCNEVMYKIPDSCAIKLIENKENNNIWEYYGYDTWLYDAIEYNMIIWVRIKKINGFTSFFYTF